MDITLDELFRRLLEQMKRDTELSSEEKEILIRKLEKKIKEEGLFSEEK
ncbi:MAG: hypothetical protein IK999_04610 [Ruminococcus sp.]|nr:hypothetical protein [Ruminococcus sp.]MBQ1434089.1 hypothetical protein [Ruminococcus sp.]